MKKTICILAAALVAFCACRQQPRLVILHTNDTHSHFEPLRGVKASYSGTVKVVRRPKPISDEDLAKNVGMENIDTMRETIR